jgi:two-component system cell cycle response regulator
VPARILVIEDTAHNLYLMTYLLEASGHTVLAARDGLEGLDRVRIDRPDLVILDLELPRLSGEEVLAAIRADRSLDALPVVAVTASAMIGDRERLIEAGCTGYISKPLEPATFVGELETYLPPALLGNPLVAWTVVGPNAAEPEAKGLRVLVVDDWPTNIEVLRGILEPNGYEVVSATTAAGAVEVALKVHPDLILADVHLAGDPPMAVRERILTEPSLVAIPFAFVSSSAVPGSNDRRLAETQARFLERPGDPVTFLAEVADLVTDRAG